MRSRRYAAAADTRAPPDAATKRILSPEGMKEWWLGPIQFERIDDTWPQVGSTMRFRSGGRFDARVVEASPGRVTMEVQAPSGPSVVTHSFSPLPGGGTHYEKTVEARLTGVSGTLFAPLMSRFLRREVSRAAKDAERAASAARDTPP